MMIPNTVGYNVESVATNFDQKVHTVMGFRISIGAVSASTLGPNCVITKDVKSCTYCC